MPQGVGGIIPVTPPSALRERATESRNVRSGRSTMARALSRDRSVVVPRGLTIALVWPYHNFMASLSIRSTYALDRETVDRLDSLAREWRVSKSEALRRAIRAAAPPASAADRLATLDALQSSARLSARRAESWLRDVRRERKRSAR